MGMNDWDGLSGEHDENAGVASSQAGKTESEKKVVPMSPVAAKNNNKTMYLAMGGLMLFVMGVYGYYQYMQLQAAQNDERMRQQQAFKNQKEDAERKKREAEAKDKPVVAATEKPVAETAAAPASQPQNDDLAALAQLKNRNGSNPAAPVAAATTATTAAPAPAPVAVPAQTANTMAPRPVLQSAAVAPTYAPSQDAQKREQYVSMLEGRVNDLGLTKLRLEAELCKYEPRRAFCNASNKSGAVPEAQREPVQANIRSGQQVQSVQPAQQVQSNGGRVMLFDTARPGSTVATELPRISTKTSVAQAQNPGARTQIMDATPKALSLQGLTILRDRVLYRDRDGLTHEVELGGDMEGLGRLERIDFERKSFQAGGRTYN
ncbi:hypothetical protein [Undibacterium sp. KW1]|uniref:hypothetical protein n=1 Tax=Undibacterium sp. KW1 TaxID=2058624 RepID=UPI00138A3C64|nr:hypothetical protein [Undibacterium sp. KW1]